jgi:hypothetical protein
MGAVFSLRDRLRVRVRDGVLGMDLRADGVFGIDLDADLRFEDFLSGVLIIVSPSKSAFIRFIISKLL